MQQPIGRNIIWDEERIRCMVEDRETESLNLDYKRIDSLGSSDGKKREIAKDISSFANSAGGTVIYGIEEDPEKRFPLNVAGINPADFSKETLENIITSNIQPRIMGVIITPVELLTLDPGHVLYVVDIPESYTAHMSADKRYYRRFNFKAEIMEDYEVRLVMNRTTTPDLYCSFAVDTGQYGYVPFTTGQRSDPFTIDVTLHNRSLEPAPHALIRVFVDQRLEPDFSKLSNVAVQKYLDFNVGERRFNTDMVTKGWGGLSLPIWQGINYSAFDAKISATIDLQAKWQPIEYDLIYWVSAPKMGVRSGGYRLTLEHSNLTLSEALDLDLSGLAL